LFYQFDEVRRKAKFMAAKIVPNIRSRGTTPGPKLAASPTIHSRMANVKIVQNTALLPECDVALKIQQLRLTVMGPEKTFPVMGFDWARFPRWVSCLLV